MASQGQGWLASVCWYFSVEVLLIWGMYDQWSFRGVLIVIEACVMWGRSLSLSLSIVLFAWVSSTCWMCSIKSTANRYHCFCLSYCVDSGTPFVALPLCCFFKVCGEGMTELTVLTTKRKFAWRRREVPLAPRPHTRLMLHVGVGSLDKLRQCRCLPAKKLCCGPDFHGRFLTRIFSGVPCWWNLQQWKLCRWRANYIYVYLYIYMYISFFS